MWGKCGEGVGVRCEQGPTPDGGFGYLDNMTPERVEAGGECCECGESVGMEIGGGVNSNMGAVVPPPTAVSVTSTT